MHTVSFTKTFLAGADRLGLAGDALERVTDLVAANPRAGQCVLEIEGLYARTITRDLSGADEDVEVLVYSVAEDVPAFLLDVSFVGEALDLTRRERAELADTLGQVETEYRASARRKVVELRKNHGQKE